MEFEKLKKIIAEVCDVDEDKITMDSTFKDDLDADSLDVFQIVTAIEDEFELEISDEDAEKIVTVGDAVEQIQNATGNNYDIISEKVRKKGLSLFLTIGE